MSSCSRNKGETQCVRGLSPCRLQAAVRGNRCHQNSPATDRAGDPKHSNILGQLQTSYCQSVVVAIGLNAGRAMFLLNYYQPETTHLIARPVRTEASNQDSGLIACSQEDGHLDSTAAAIRNRLCVWLAAVFIGQFLPSELLREFIF